MEREAKSKIREGEIQMKKYNKVGIILLIALCFLCLKTQCTEIQAAEKYKTTNLAQIGRAHV